MNIVLSCALPVDMDSRKETGNGKQPPELSPGNRLPTHAGSPRRKLCRHIWQDVGRVGEIAFGGIV